MEKVVVVHDDSIFKNNRIEDSYNERIIYKLVCESFYMYGLDKENYQTAEWNPLKEFIQPENTVLIKPNLVKDFNQNGSVKCLYTQKEIIKPIIDFVLKALNNKGAIIVGDAPVQECDFEKLIIDSGYSELIENYQKQGIDISLVDFRNTRSYVKDGMHYYEECSEADNRSTSVNLKEHSAFSELPEEGIESLRITNYAPSVMNKYHSKESHIYKVTNCVLEADVVVSVPKIKTHRLAGMTASLKNVIGICANKEMLPHHRIGCKSDGGDSYQHKSEKMEHAYSIKDRVNELNLINHQNEAKELEKEFIKEYLDAKKETHEKYDNGFWHGNDTIWRTIADINKIIRYADKNGVLKEDIQRKILIVADMIVAGEEEGPLHPTPKVCGTIIMGEDTVAVDRVICSLMGFDYRLLPTLNNDYLRYKKYKISDCDQPQIVSNNEKWNNRSLTYICENSSFDFLPTKGWREVLKNGSTKSIIPEVQNSKELYIFGAGTIGVSTYLLLFENEICIKGFLDNDKNKHGEIIIDGKKCYSPDEIENNCSCIVAVGNKYHDIIIEQLKGMGISSIYSWTQLEK